MIPICRPNRLAWPLSLLAACASVTRGQAPPESAATPGVTAEIRVADESGQPISAATIRVRKLPLSDAENLDFRGAFGEFPLAETQRRVNADGTWRSPELTDYLAFLKGGCFKDALDLLRDAGVDMEKPEPVDTALKFFGQLTDELDELL